MVVDQDGPREIRYDMLRPIPNDKDGPHYELIPQDGLSQSLALVPILEQVQSDLPDAKIYWNQPEHDILEPLYGTLKNTKGELPRIELFNDQIDREALVLQKYEAIKNKEAQLDLARTLLIKSYDDLKQSITPKRQEQNVLQIYNEELLKQIAKDESLNNKKIQKQDNKKVIMSTKGLILETERSSPRFEFLKVQNNLSKNNIISHRRNYLPIIELPTNTQSDQTLSQYMFSQSEEKMPSIRNNLVHIQKNLPADSSEFAPSLPKIRPTVSEHTVALRKKLKNSHDKLMPINNERKITKNNMPFEVNLIPKPRKTLDQVNQNSQSTSKYSKTVRQFEKFSWPNKSIRFESNKLPQRTSNVLVPHKALKITQNDWRIQYGHDNADKSSKSNKSLVESMPHQNVLHSQSRDSNLGQNQSQKPPLPLTNVVHIKDTVEHFITNDESLKNQLHYTVNKKTNEKNLEETLSYTGQYGEQPQFNDDSKLCRLKGGKLICDVPMEHLILKEPIPDALQSKHQMNEGQKQRKKTTRHKLTIKQRSSTHKRRFVQVKKIKASGKEEMSNEYQVVHNEKTAKKNILKNNYNKKRIW